MTSSNTCEVRVGRLMEINVAMGYRNAGDVADMISMIGGALGKLPPTTNVVIAADWRQCQLMDPAAAEKALVMLTTDNARIERSGILTTNDSPVAVMQFLRLVLQSKHPNRRIFHDAREMAAWLSEPLSIDERARLHQFLKV